MDSSVVFDLWLIAAFWASFAFIRFAVSQAPGAKPGVSRYHLWKTEIDRMDTDGSRPRYLCGYHAGSENRMGLSSIVDSKRCEYCLEDQGYYPQGPQDAA